MVANLHPFFIFIQYSGKVFTRNQKNAPSISNEYELLKIN